MERINCPVRNDWKKRVEELGFGFHTIDGTYWDESAYYQFSMREVNELEAATVELFDRCLDAVQYVIDHKLYDLFKIDQRFVPLIESSWNEDAPSIYGRFDLVYDGRHAPKMLEFNADTPTSLFEGGVVQWYWLEDVKPGTDQFNSIHEKLVGYWKTLIPYLNEGKLHFSCLKDNLEDLTTVEYLRDCAIQAGIDTEFVYLEDIGWNQYSLTFVDLQEQNITNLFKLYPWEWLIREAFADNLLIAPERTVWIEPAWKMILSNKAILPVLWQLFPNHPNLLEAYFDNSKMAFDYVKKPFFSREGENVTIVRNGKTIAQTAGLYGSEGYIYQKYCELPNFKLNYPVIGSWVIGCEPAGMGIRETNTLITDNLSRFIPHIIN
ncbi:glutathionylspermidine synthase family protein [Paludibacter jiangxiensis]|uniref:Glutathionylspermidine synthase n=1 Tax=Paludibacter jiangxiensis TaxID=681398 RepID=A0A171ABJ1_9BACT|nr:glutathionylspermidine synthase family protein [Paludibacter jiangxiensis]GAT63483.1 glutathionylspermidine synthase [Paludibacter jiangxiensis]